MACSRGACRQPKLSGRSDRARQDAQPRHGRAILLAAAPVAALAFVAILALAAIAVANGLVADDALRLWAGASTAADGQVPIGRIVAAYPTLPFLATTLVAWLAPAGTPAPALGGGRAVCAFRRLLLSGVSQGRIADSRRRRSSRSWWRSIRRCCGPSSPDPSDMFLAVFLLMFASRSTICARAAARRR